MNQPLYTVDRYGARRRGDWIQTYSGRQFFPLDPQFGEIALIDIAAALSKLTRYCGHCLRFYSVAEHSVLMARHLLGQGEMIEVVRAALLHDASEAYLVDVPRPIKGELGPYREIEDGLMHVIASRFGFDWPLRAVVKHADDAILADELAQNMSPPPVPWHQITGAPLGVTLQCWLPDKAFVEFMRMASDCGAAE